MTDCPHRYFGVAYSGDEPYARCVDCGREVPNVRVSFAGDNSLVVLVNVLPETMTVSTHVVTLH